MCKYTHILFCSLQLIMWVDNEVSYEMKLKMAHPDSWLHYKFNFILKTEKCKYSTFVCAHRYMSCIGGSA